VPRALSAVALTVIGLGALAMFHSTPPAHGKSLASRVPTRTAPAPAATAPPATAPPADPSSPAPPTHAPPPAPTPATTPAPAPPAAAPANTQQSYDGDPVDNQFGTVQVRITVQNHKITAVDALQMPYDHMRSQYISEQAGPMLQQEALQAQSAQIDLISGATYTSESYAQSLQSAIDRAHM